MKDIAIIQLTCIEEKCLSFILVKGEEDYSIAVSTIKELTKNYNVDENGYYLLYIEKGLKKAGVNFKLYANATKEFIY